MELKDRKIRHDIMWRKTPPAANTEDSCRFGMQAPDTRGREQSAPQPHDVGRRVRLGGELDPRVRSDGNTITRPVISEGSSCALEKTSVRSTRNRCQRYPSCGRAGGHAAHPAASGHHIGCRQGRRDNRSGMAVPSGVRTRCCSVLPPQVVRDKVATHSAGTSCCSWSWMRSQKIVQRISAETHRMVRPHFRREPGVGWKAARPLHVAQPKLC